jgi:hypothetical protein
MDPLSEVLSLLKPRSHPCGGTGVAGDFSVQFPRQYRRGRIPSSPPRTNDALSTSVGIVEC